MFGIVTLLTLTYVTVKQFVHWKYLDRKGDTIEIDMGDTDKVVFVLFTNCSHTHTFATGHSLCADEAK